MNLIKGEVVSNEILDTYFECLDEYINETLQKPLLSSEVVINACDKFASTLQDTEVVPILEGLGMSNEMINDNIKQLRVMFSAEYLRTRLDLEIGSLTIKRKPMDIEHEVVEQIYPLGVLFHIAAGNMDGLPVLTVIEGLLTGNINLLKLPSVDGGISIMILQKLCAIEPILKDYIYVFELSSKETMSISKLINLSNAVVVWGADETVAAIRKITPASIKLIEWGHKLSFAYITKQGMSEEELEGLAHNICSTNQLLCSSCQGIFVDTDNEKEAVEFAEMFSTILDDVSKGYNDIPLSAKAQCRLQLYTMELESKNIIYSNDGTSVYCESDSNLTSSIQFRNVWVRCLSKDKIIANLHKYKGILQTVALLCANDEKEEISSRLFKAGVVRITSGKYMSSVYCGMPHDGEYALSRYIRRVSMSKD